MILFFWLFEGSLSLWGRKKGLRDQLGFPYLPDCKVIYYENFSDPNVLDYWTKSYDHHYSGKWKAEQLYQLQSRRGERGIVMKTQGKSHAISHKFRHPISFLPNETFILQYEARAEFIFMCSSGFIQIFTSPSFNPEELTNETEHFIEFGPERCFNFNQTRFTILTYETDPTTGKRKAIEHKLKHTHWIPTDEITHLYTIIIRPDGTFEYMIDNRSMRNGTFIDDFDPPLFDTPYIDDPADVKPLDWDDRVLIPDPNEVKPDDWDDNAPFNIPDPKKKNPPEGWLIDEPKYIPDPKAVKPASWDDEKMGPWQPPSVPNPKCFRVPGCGPYKPPLVRNPKARGVWKPKLIQNPNYKGEFRPRKIKNPNYKPPKITKSDADTNSNNSTSLTEKFVMPTITGIGFNVWTAYRDFAFTNILIANDVEAVKRWNSEDFNPRQRRQIRAIKINYQWIYTDEPPDKPEPGLIGHLEYYQRCVQRRWDRVHNKTAVLAISFTLLVISLPITVMCWDLFSDPFPAKKYD